MWNSIGSSHLLLSNYIHSTWYQRDSIGCCYYSVFSSNSSCIVFALESSLEYNLGRSVLECCKEMGTVLVFWWAGIFTPPIRGWRLVRMMHGIV